MVCAIWYHLHKNMKNTHGGVLLLVKLQACTNGTKTRKVPHFIIRFRPMFPLLPTKNIRESPFFYCFVKGIKWKNLLEIG